jgi:integrase
MGANKTDDLSLRLAKAKDKPYKISDGDGLYLIVSPSKGKELPTGRANKWWRFKYRFDGKEKGLSFGTYPETTLSDARKKRDVARSQIKDGIDPSVLRKAEKATDTGSGSFEAIAREWHEKWTAVEWSASHSKNILVRFQKHVFPWVGARPINKLSPPEMLAVFRRIEATGHLETLHRTISNCGQVFRHAIFTGRAEIDPTYKMGEAFADPIKKHYAAILDPVEVGFLMRAIFDYHGRFITRCALMLAPLFMLRPVELRLAEWSEIDLDRAEWRIPIRRMKRTRRDKEAFPNEIHLVPLAKQAVAILRELHPLTGSGRLVFSGMRSKDRAISEATLTNGLRLLGYDKETMHIHGFRAMGRTLIREQLKISAEVIERQLSHGIDNPLGKAYDRTTFVPERKQMMQAYADYLDRLTSETNIVPLRAAQ